MFLFRFPDRHAKFRNKMAFPMAPVGFAQACQHRVAFLLDRDHQVVFFCLIGRALRSIRMAWWEPLGMRTARPVLMSMASHDWFNSRRKVSSITDPFTSHANVQQSKSCTTNLIRVGGEFQISPEFPPLRIDTIVTD